MVPVRYVLYIDFTKISQQIKYIPIVYTNFLGWVNKLRSEHDEDNIFIGNTRYYLSKAKEVHTKNPTKDKEMINHINELLNEIGPEPDEEENGENDTDNLWEDLDDSDEEQEETNEMEQT